MRIDMLRPKNQQFYCYLGKKKIKGYNNFARERMPNLIREKVEIEMGLYTHRDQETTSSLLFKLKLLIMVAWRKK